MKNILNIGKARKRLSPVKMSTWFSSLESFLSSGLPIVDALNLIGTTPWEKTVAKAIQSRLEQGDSLRLAMEQSGCFDDFSLAVVESGEVSGHLDLAFEKLRIFYQQKEQFRKNLMQAMVYPALVFCSLLFLVLFILFYFVPSMAKLYDSRSMDMLSSSVRVIHLCLFLNQYFVPMIYTLFLFVLLLATGIYLILENRSDLPPVFRLPIFGEVFRKQKMNEILWSIAMMTDAGMDILQSIHTVEQSQRHPGIKSRLCKIAKDISLGISLKESVRKNVSSEEKLIYFIGVGEQTGDLSEKLKDLSLQYREEANGRYRVIVALLQPVMILGMVITVGALMLGIVLPLLDVNMIYRM